MIDYTTIGKAIKLNRIKCDLTQEELAEKIDVSTDYISKIENALKHPSLKTLDSLAEAFDIDLCALVSDTNPNRNDYGVTPLIEITKDFEPETKALLLKTAESFIDIDNTLKSIKNK